jgi:hypothetical protein
MTVYVDDARLPYRSYRMSHMQADTLDELHAMADAIGLRREWFQPGSRPEAAHYDVSDAKRRQAFALGAIPETVLEGAERRRGLPPVPDHSSTRVPAPQP